jgi:hypothetical protein
MSYILEAVDGIVISYSILTTAFSIALKNSSKAQFQQVLTESGPLKICPKLDYEKVPALTQGT